MVTTHGVEGAAALLNVSDSVVLELAQTGRLKGAKVGIRWVFLEEDVAAFLRAEIDRQTASRRAEAARPPPLHPIKRGRGRPRKVSPQPGSQLTTAEIGVTREHP